MLNLISLNVQGHARLSGYGRLTEYLPGQVLQPPQSRIIQSISSRVFRSLPSFSGSEWYEGPHFLNEIRTAWHWSRQSNHIFHFLYGENAYRYLKKMTLRSQRNAIVCTYHTPPDEFCQVVTDRSHLVHLDAAIVVSTMQIDFFAELLGPERIFYVPHGIDVDYFSPPAGPKIHREEIHCLFVGSHLRDFETLAGACKLLQERHKKLLVSVVTSRQHHKPFAGLHNVRLYSGLSDDGLLELYRQSDMLVLPLLGSTANNSLLEAMACGLPIISTELPGVKDYVHEACAVLTPYGDPMALAEAMVRLGEDEAQRKSMALASRLRALEFRWQNIASQVKTIYRRISGTLRVSD